MVGLAAVGLAGCETLGARKPAPAPVEPVAVAPPPEVTPTPVTPVVRPTPAPARSCVPRGLSASPRYPDSDAALRNAAGAADRYQLMAAGRLMRQKRLEELERVIAGCR